MKAYFYCTDGSSVSGPVSIDELIRLKFSGDIGDMAQVCEQGSEVWMPLATILLAHRQQEQALKLTSPVYATAAKRSVEQSSNSGGGGLIATGIVCALVSLLFLPPAFGLAALVCGIVGVAKGNVGGGIVVIILAVTCGLAGMYIGAMLMSQ